MDTATFLAQHTAPLRDWPAEDVLAYFATSAELQPILNALPPEHTFRKVTGAKLYFGLSNPLGQEFVAGLIKDVSDDGSARLEMGLLIEQLKSHGTCSCFLAACVCCCSCGP